MPAGGPRVGHDLTGGPITRTLVMFSLPTLGANIVTSLNGSINAVWVGRLLGETALTATANGNLLLFFLLSAVFGFGMAATILVGQNMGRRDIVAARRAIGTAAGLFMIVGCAIAAVGWIFAPQLLRMMDTPPAARLLGIQYLRILFLGLPPLYFLIFLTMALRGAGDARTPFFFILLSAAIDVTLNPTLILGLGGFPRLGIMGSGWSMFIAQTVSLIAMLVYIYVRKLPLRLSGSELRFLKPDPALLRSIVVKGVPMGLQMTVVSVSALFMISFVNRYGVATAAAYGVMAQVWNYIQMPAMAIGAAVSAMAAQNVGAGLWERVDRITRSGIIINLVMTGLMVLVILFLENHVIRLFLPSDTGAMAVARRINHVASWGFILFGITLVIFGTVRATGAVMGPLAVLFLAMFPARIGFVLMFRENMGADAIWWSFPVGSIAAVLLAVLYYRKAGWRTMRMGGHAPDPLEAEDMAHLPAEGAGQPPQAV